MQTKSLPCLILVNAQSISDFLSSRMVSPWLPVDLLSCTISEVIVATAKELHSTWTVKATQTEICISSEGSEASFTQERANENCDGIVVCYVVMSTQTRASLHE
jgi:hypothetical protein